MHRRRLYMVLCMILLTIIPNSVSYGQNSTTDTVQMGESTRSEESLEFFIREALHNNPEIKAYKEKREASIAKIPQSGSWNDPQLSFNIVNIPLTSFDFGLEPMTGKQIFLMQQIPFPGRTSLKEKAAVEDENITGELLTEKKNEVIRNVKNAYFNLYLTDKSIEITEKNKSLLDSFIKIVQGKYEVGKGLQQDVLKSQVEYSKLMEKLISLRQRRGTMAARINTLLNRSPETQISKLAEVGKSQFDLKTDELAEIAFDRRPMLKAMQNQIEKNEYLNELAKKDYYPNFNVSLGYTQRDKRRDFFSAMFSINLPIFAGRKQNKKVEETAHTTSAVRESYIGMKNEVRYKIKELTANIEEYDKLMELLQQGIIPQASQSLQSAIAGYQVDKVDFLTLLNNQMTLFNYEIEYYRLLTNYEKNIADLEFITGKQLNNNM